MEQIEYSETSTHKIQRQGITQKKEYNIQDSRKFEMKNYFFAGKFERLGYKKKLISFRYSLPDTFRRYIYIYMHACLQRNFKDIFQTRLPNSYAQEFESCG